MEALEQFFNKCEQDFVFLDKAESSSEQYPRKLSEIKRVIEITDPTLEEKDLMVHSGRMDNEENGFIDIFLVDRKSGNEYALSQSGDRFNTTCYVLSKISFEEGVVDKELIKDGIDSAENSRLKNSEIIVGEKILKAKYLALSIGKEWFTSKDSLFTDGLNTVDNSIVFNILFLD